jgi:hypothetical protein
MRFVTCSKRSFSSASVKVTGSSTSPSIVSSHESGSPVGLGRNAVLAHEELLDRGGVVVEQVLGRLGDEGTIADHRQARVLRT